MGYSRFFFSQTGLFFRPVPYPINKKYVFLAKNSLNYYSLKVTKFHGDCVKMRLLGQKKNYRVGAKRPPPACLGLKGLMSARRDYKGLPFNELKLYPGKLTLNLSQND